MANTVSSYLAPYIVAEAREALKETFALLGNTNHDFSTAQASSGQTVTIGVPAALTAASVTAANTAPAPSDITIGYQSITLSNEYKTAFAIQMADTQNYELSSVFMQQVREAVRGMAYKVNATLWEKYYRIPYAVGNSGTGAFYDGSAYNLDNLAAIDWELTKNRCPFGNRKLVVSLKDYADLLKTDSVQKVNYAGTDSAIRLGVIEDLLGFQIHRDQQSPTHTIGTITTGLTVKAATAHAAGATSVTATTAASTGACALKKGDILLINGYNYALQADATQASAETDVTLTLDRGLETALTGGEAIILSTSPSTFDANSLVNIGGDFSGFSVVGRMPAVEFMGYKAQGDHFPIVDDVSGFPFMLSIYPQYKQVALEVSAIWGVEVTDSRKLCRLLTYSS